jgi:hypothetical protein
MKLKLKYAGDRLFILVGQEGQSACVIQGVESRDGLCAMQVSSLVWGDQSRERLSAMQVYS